MIWNFIHIAQLYCIQYVCASRLHPVRYLALTLHASSSQLKILQHLLQPPTSTVQYSTVHNSTVQAVVTSWLKSLIPNRPESSPTSVSLVFLYFAYTAHSSKVFPIWLKAGCHAIFIWPGPCTTCTGVTVESRSMLHFNRSTRTHTSTWTQIAVCSRHRLHALGSIQNLSTHRETVKLGLSVCSHSQACSDIFSLCFIKHCKSIALA